MAKLLDKNPALLPAVYINLEEYRPALKQLSIAAGKGETPQIPRKVVALYKLLSATHLLKLPFANDSNTLNRNFYTELLHILGLEEHKVKNAKYIRRKVEGKRDDASLLEATISKLNASRLYELNNRREFGENLEEQSYGVALALVITWTNRVLFCKLLEAQLLGYHGGDRDYAFLNGERVRDYDQLWALFFDVLAIPEESRTGAVAKTFGRVPYLNSSLFEETSLEKACLNINQLPDGAVMPVYEKSVLRKQGGATERVTLHYLFEFLDAYDFSNEDADAVQEESKSLINASVLGLIFEKINGYKEGSFYTPGFVTEYMVRETIRPAVVKRFRAATAADAEVKSVLPPFTADSFNALRNYCGKINEPAMLQVASQVIDTLTVCDPAVGSGHFLVSALNELLSIKSELGLLLDEEGVSIGNEVDVEVANDELVVLRSADEAFFEYKPFVAKSDRVQRTLFEQKRRLIEGCLHGVDINPNSVKICRLRLWIELLKHAYYNKDRQLETLPNIDINIKTGNSLVRRFKLDADLKQALRKSKRFNIDSYRIAVASYRGARSSQEKRQLRAVIEEIKESFSTAIQNTDPSRKNLARARGEVQKLDAEVKLGNLFAEGATDAKNAELTKAQAVLVIEEKKFDDAEAGLFYLDAFEWRFEFPAVLDDDGEFMGFDVVVGNPPYIRHEELGAIKTYLSEQYAEVYRGTADILVYFIQLGLSIAAEGGLFSYIVSNKFMRAGYGKELRGYLTDFRLRELIDFGDLPVFSEATTYPLIIVAEREAPLPTYTAANVEELLPNGFRQNLKSIRFEGSMASLASSGWSLTDSSTFERMQHLRQQGVPLGKFVDGKMYRGILTGFNEAFVIDEGTAQRLIDAGPRSEEVIKPFIGGRDIKRYEQPVADKYLIKFERGQTYGIAGAGIDEQAAHNVMSDLYPSVFGWLDQHVERAKKRQDKGDFWWELRACAYWEEFDRTKIMYPDISSTGSFTFDTSGACCANTGYIMSFSELWLVALLNTRLLTEYYQNSFSVYRGGYYRFFTDYMVDVPIVEPSPKQKEALTRLVERRMLLFPTDVDRVGEVEREIEGIVRVVYGV